MQIKWRLKACVFGLAALILFLRNGMMTPEEAYGCVLWACVFFLSWKVLKAQHQQRRIEHAPGAIPSTDAVPVRVSQMGPAWEQDAPYPEVFDEEDDL